MSKTEDLLTKFGMTDAKCTTTPMTTGYVKEVDESIQQQSVVSVFSGILAVPIMLD